MQKLHQHLSLSDFNAAVAPIALANARFPVQDKQQNQSPGGNEQASVKKIPLPRSTAIKS